MGGLHAKSMTSQRYRATYKMADMRYYGNVMKTTRWRLCVTILHLQQYSRRLNLFFRSLLFLKHHQRIYSARSCKQFVVPNNRTVWVATCTPGSSVERRGYGLSDHRVGMTKGRGTQPAF